MALHPQILLILQIQRVHSCLGWSLTFAAVGCSKDRKR